MHRYHFINWLLKFFAVLNQAEGNAKRLSFGTITIKYLPGNERNKQDVNDLLM